MTTHMDSERSRPDVTEVDELILDIRDDTATDSPVEAPPTREMLPPEVGLLAAPAWKFAVKRAIDIVGGTLLLLAVTPIIVAAAIAVKITSPGPIFYISDRVGQHGRSFRFWKIRTMVVDADAIKDDLGHHNEAAGPVFKMKDDPRVTPVGKFLRKISLDELPQFWNVIKGDMSLVGPRPPIVSEVDEYGPWEHQRLLVKPGITCIWQVSGRSNIDFDRWVELDLEYIEQWSLGLDVAILAKTVPAIVRQDGAY